MRHIVRHKEVTLDDSDLIEITKNSHYIALQVKEAIIQTSSFVYLDLSDVSL